MIVFFGSEVSLSQMFKLTFLLCHVILMLYFFSAECRVVLRDCYDGLRAGDHVPGPLPDGALRQLRPHPGP